MSRRTLGGQERIEWSRVHYVAMRGRENRRASSNLKPCRNIDCLVAFMYYKKFCFNSILLFHYAIVYHNT